MYELLVVIWFVLLFVIALLLIVWALSVCALMIAELYCRFFRKNDKTGGAF